MQYARVLIVVLTAPLIVALFLGGSDGGPLAARRARREPGGRPTWPTRPVACAGRARPRPAARAAGRLRAAADGRGGRAERHGAGGRRPRAGPRPGRRLRPRGPAGRPPLHAGDGARGAPPAPAPCWPAIAALIAACALLAVVLELMTGVTYADAYLATTPGGLYAVIATALDGGGTDPAFVFAVQALRLLIMVLAAPFLVRLLVPRPRGARLSAVARVVREARPSPPRRGRARASGRPRTASPASQRPASLQPRSSAQRSDLARVAGPVSSGHRRRRGARCHRGR